MPLRALSKNVYHHFLLVKVKGTVVKLGRYLLAFNLKVSWCVLNIVLCLYCAIVFISVSLCTFLFPRMRNTVASSTKASRQKHYSSTKRRPASKPLSHWRSTLRPTHTYNYIYNAHTEIIYIWAEFVTIEGNWKFVVLTPQALHIGIALSD